MVGLLTCLKGRGFTAMYAGVLTAGALEYKDRAHGGKWDWIDFALTVVGAFVGGLIFSWA